MFQKYLTKKIILCLKKTIAYRHHCSRRRILNKKSNYNRKNNVLYELIMPFGRKCSQKVRNLFDDLNKSNNLNILSLAHITYYNNYYYCIVFGIYMINVFIWCLRKDLTLIQLLLYSIGFRNSILYRKTYNDHGRIPTPIRQLISTEVTAA